MLTIYVSAYYYICVRILLYMFPHTTIYVSAYYCICVLIRLYMCPHTTVYVSAYDYICVLILLHRGHHYKIYIQHQIHYLLHSWRGIFWDLMMRRDIGRVYMENWVNTSNQQQNNLYYLLEIQVTVLYIHDIG
jgi:hypothetical protein